MHSNDYKLEILFWIIVEFWLSNMSSDHNFIWLVAFLKPEGSVQVHASARFVSWIAYLCLIHSHVGSVRAQCRQKHPPGIKHVSPSQHCHWASWEYLCWRAPTVLGLASDYHKEPPLPGRALRTGQQKQRVWITLESMLSQLHQFVLYKDRLSILSSSMMLLISIYILIIGSLWEHDSCNEKSGMKCHAMYVLWRKYQGRRPKHHKPQQTHCP